MVADAAIANSPADLKALKAVSLGGQTVQEKVTELLGKIGEKLEVTAYEMIAGDAVASYIHSNGKLGVLVALAGVNGADVADAGKDVGMQIAAMNMPLTKMVLILQLLRKKSKDQARQEERLFLTKLLKVNCRSSSKRTLYCFR